MAGAGLYEVGPGKTYSTIQSALDQLWTDQGSAEFAATQYIRIFADTYTEDIVPNAALAPDFDHGKYLIMEGDPADSRANIILQASANIAIDANCDQLWVRHMKVLGTGASRCIYMRTGVTHSKVSDCHIEGAGTYLVYLFAWGQVEDCRIIQGTSSYAIFSTTGLHVIRTEIALSHANGIAIMSRFGCILDAVIVDGGLNAVDFVANYERWNPLRIANCTFYNVTNGVRFIGGGCAHVEVINTIFKDVDYPYRSSVAGEWPQEASSHVGPDFVQRNNCYHGYTAYGYDGTNTKTASEWAAFNQVDVSGELDATAPLMTDPANDDFSLQATSPCRNTGHGSGVLSDVQGTAYDAHHPDMGALSTGALTVAAPTISTAVDDETGTSATLTLSADNVLDVLSVHYRRRQETEWTTHGSTRTGSGSLQITGLVQDQHYWFICTAARGGEISLPSGATGVTVTTGDWEATLEAAWRTRLLENATVEGLLGVRLYGGVAPQDAELPYAVFTVISDVPWHHMEAASRYARARIQLDCYAESYAAVKALAKACREAVDGLDREVTVGSDTNVLTIMLEMQADGDNERAAGAELGPYRVIQDYVVLHDETLPALA